MLSRPRLGVRRPEDAHQRHHRGSHGQAVLLRPRVSQARRLLHRFQTRLRRLVHVLYNMNIMIHIITYSTNRHIFLLFHYPSQL